jgi:hypothetical protein
MGKMITLLFTICLIKIILTEDCLTKYQYYMFTYNPLDMNNPFGASGLGFNNMGNYEICVSNSDNKYVLIEAQSDSKAFIYKTGICLPSECIKEGYNLAPDLIDYINQKFLENGYKGFEYRFPDHYYNVYTQINIWKLVATVIAASYLFFGSGLVHMVLNAISPDQVKKQEKNDDEALKLNEEDTTMSKILTNNLTISNIMENNRRLSPFRKALKGFFNIYSNYEYLFAPRKYDKGIHIFDGIKFILGLIVIALQYFSYIDNFPAKNESYREDFYKSFTVQIVFNWSYKLYVFLGIRGFMVAYTGYKRINLYETKGFKFLITEVVLKFLRLWPLYAFIIFVYLTYFVYLIDGPFSSYYYDKEVNDSSSKLPFLLSFIDNYYHWQSGDKTFLWVISLNFQLSLVGLLLLYLYSKNKKLFLIIFIFINLIALGIEIFTFYNLDEIGVNVFEYKKYGFAPCLKYIWTNSFPFMSGFLLGLLYSIYSTKRLFDYEKSTIDSFFNYFKHNKIASFVFWLFGTSIFIFVIVFPCWSFNEEWSMMLKLIYYLVLRKLQILGFFMCCIPLLVGNFYILGGWLGSSFFTNCGKLAYAAFLVQHFVIRFLMLNSSTSIVYGNMYMLLLVISFRVFSYIAAIPLALCFEVPFLRIKDYLRKTDNSDERPTTETLLKN